MTDTSKPIVRLETSSAAKKAQKKAVAEAKEQTIKLAIRLNEGINEALRTLIRYRGDLSTMALEALDAVDLTRAALVSADERMVRRQCSQTVCSNQLIANHDLHVICRKLLHLGDLMRGPKSVEEMNKRNASLQCGGLGNQSTIHDLLH